MGWGGVNILPRQHFERVAGFDERFQGWGGEDDAFAFSLNHLFGLPFRIDATIFHLWHPAGILSHYMSNRTYLQAYLAGPQSVINEIEKRKNQEGKVTRILLLLEGFCPFFVVLFQYLNLVIS